MPDCALRHVPLEDRPLLTVDLSEQIASGHAGLLSASPGAADGLPEGAIVRVKYQCTAEQSAGSAAAAARFIDALYEAGAGKVIGPQVTVIAEEREARSDLTVDVDPLLALESWLAQADVPESLRPAVTAAAKEIIG